jgi:hypothetical protein
MSCFFNDTLDVGNGCILFNNFKSCHRNTAVVRAVSNYTTHAVHNHETWRYNNNMLFIITTTIIIRFRVCHATFLMSIMRQTDKNFSIIPT